MGIKGKHVWELLPWGIQVDILSRLSTKDLRNLEGVCKDWQSIIKSPRFHMLQINANPNQDGFIVNPYEYHGKYHIEPLSSNKIYKFDFSTNCGKIHTSRILAVSNGLVLVNLSIYGKPDQLLVHNPITRQCIKLPQPSPKLFIYLERNCDFFEHDLQSSSYKIFVASYTRVYIYSSSSCKWKVVDSFSNFKLNLEPKIYGRPFSCIMYKNNMYMAFSTLDNKWMVVVYNPKDDAWSNPSLSKEETYYLSYTYGGRFIIADDRLFFVHVDNYYSLNDTTIAIFELNIEDRLFIQITKFTCKHDFLGCFSHNSIIGLGNKITIMKNIKDIFMTFNTSTNEEQVFRNNDVAECSCAFGKYPYKFTLVSP